MLIFFVNFLRSSRRSRSPLLLVLGSVVTAHACTVSAWGQTNTLEELLNHTLLTLSSEVWQYVGNSISTN